MKDPKQHSDSAAKQAAVNCRGLQAGGTRLDPRHRRWYVQCLLYFYLDLMLILQKYTNNNIARKKKGRVEWALNVER